MTRAFLPLHWAFVLIAAGCLAVYLDHTGKPAAALSRWSPGGSAPATSASPSGPIVAGFQPVPATLAAVGESVPLRLDGDVGFNIRAALDANSSALRDITIQPGVTWSFNATVGNPASVAVRTVGGVPGGGWCDLASRYVQALRPVLPPEAIRFPNHIELTGIGLADVAPGDAVSIWNTDGSAGSVGGRQDLEITNTLDRPLRLRVLDDGAQVVVSAVLGEP